MSDNALPHDLEKVIENLQRRLKLLETSVPHTAQAFTVVRSYNFETTFNGTYATVLSGRSIFSAQYLHYSVKYFTGIGTTMDWRLLASAGSASGVVIHEETGISTGTQTTSSGTVDLFDLLGETNRMQIIDMDVEIRVTAGTSSASIALDRPFLIRAQS